MTSWGESLPPLTTHWDFGAATVPRTSPGPPHTGLILQAPGTYPCSVTHTNPAGSTTEHFTLTVTLPPRPDFAPNLKISYDAGVSYSIVPEAFWPVTPAEMATWTWQWDFGGGATPRYSTEREPGVVISSPGEYSGAVTATNAGGRTTHSFTYSVYQMN